MKLICVSICAYVSMCHPYVPLNVNVYVDVASAGTMRLPNPGELQDAAGRLQESAAGDLQSETCLIKHASPIGAE